MKFQKIQSGTVASAMNFPLKRAKRIYKTWAEIWGYGVGAIARVCFEQCALYFLKQFPYRREQPREFIINLDKSTACVKEYIGALERAERVYIKYE